MVGLQVVVETFPLSFALKLYADPFLKGLNYYPLSLSEPFAKKVDFYSLSYFFLNHAKNQRP